MESAARDRVLATYRAHADRFAAIARERSRRSGTPSDTLGEPLKRAEGGLLLTERELAVLTLLAAGDSNEDIGRRLFIAVETVKSHVRGILAALQARNRAHAVAIAFRRGLLVETSVLAR